MQIASVLRKTAPRWVVADNKHDRAALPALDASNGRLMMRGDYELVDRTGDWRLDRDLWFERFEPVH